MKLGLLVEEETVLEVDLGKTKSERFMEKLSELMHFGLLGEKERG